MKKPVLFALGAVTLAVIGAAALRLPARYSEYRLRAGLMAAGMPEVRSDCISRFAVERLTLTELRKLSALESVTNRELSSDEKLGALRRVGDARVVAVMVRAAALCTTGLAR